MLIGLGTVLNHDARAATPSTGTISQTLPSITWQGQFFAFGTSAAPQQCPPNLDPLNLQCDHFFLTLDVPSDFWLTHSGTVTITIQWLDGSNDFDLFVYRESDGAQVGASTLGGGETAETVVLLNPLPGTYEVRVTAFTVLASGYNGQAQLAFGPIVNNPTYPTGGIRFAPAVMVDAQRTFGEPMIYRDTSGKLWATGPWGVSTTQSFLQKSTDNGDSYHVVSPVSLRPDNPPGGGDTDVKTDDQGTAYFADLEGAFTNVGVGVSNDGGNTWRKNAFSATTSTLDDRQWLAIDNGLGPGPADNTVFLTFHVVALGLQVFSSPGSLGVTDPVGGLVFQNAADTTFIAPDASCGQTQFDPVYRNLYLVCGRSGHVEIESGHVNPAQRTGIHFTSLAVPNSPGGGGVADLFPVLSIDTVGSLYAVWVDTGNHNIYLSASNTQGATWTTPIQINGNPANSNIFPWTVAGSPGLVEAAFLGTASPSPPASFPNWFSNRQAATSAKWFPYVVQVHFNFTSPGSSVIYQTQASEHPVHYGQICDSGTLCLETNGDRVLGDFITLTIDSSGAARVIYPDTTNQYHGSLVYESRQVSGPGLYGTPVTGTIPSNPITDQAGDAQWPHYSPTGTGTDQKALDLLSLQLSQHDAAHLTAAMRVLDATSLLPPPGATGIIWLVRWQEKALGDDGEESYRIFYAGAASTAGQPPSFFSGTGVSASDQSVPGDGCISTAFAQVNPTIRNCKVVLYPQEKTETGSFNPLTGEISITVPLADVGNPAINDTLFSVTAMSLGQVGADPLLQDVDFTRAFDYTVTNGMATTLQRVTGGGYIFTDSVGSKGTFGLSAGTDNKGKVNYVDHGTGLSFSSAVITSVVVQGNTATIKGTGFTGTVQTNFTVVAQDNADSGSGQNTFSISLDSGYSRSGALQGGSIQIH